MQVRYLCNSNKKIKISIDSLWKVWYSRLTKTITENEECSWYQ